MYLGIYELDPAHFHRLAWQAALKKTKLKLNLLSNFFNISLMVEKVLEEEYVTLFERKIKDYDMKDDDKNKEESYFKYWDVNNLHGWHCCQNFL